MGLIRVRVISGRGRVIPRGRVGVGAYKVTRIIKITVVSFHLFVGADDAAAAAAAIAAMAAGW